MKLVINHVASFLMAQVPGYEEIEHGLSVIEFENGNSRRNAKMKKVVMFIEANLQIIKLLNNIML